MTMNYTKTSQSYNLIIINQTEQVSVQASDVRLIYVVRSKSMTWNHGNGRRMTNAVRQGGLWLAQTLGLRVLPLVSGRCLEINGANPVLPFSPWVLLRLRHHHLFRQLTVRSFSIRQNGSSSREMLPLLQEQGALLIIFGWCYFWSSFFCFIGDPLWICEGGISLMRSTMATIMRASRWRIYRIRCGLDIVYSWICVASFVRSLFFCYFPFFPFFWGVFYHHHDRN